MALIEHRGTMHRTVSLRSIVGSVRTRLAVWKSRRALARLDSHLLEDIGITPLEARHEADLTAWDVPDTWRKR